MRELTLIIVLLLVLAACVPLEKELTPAAIHPTTQAVRLPPKSTETPTPAELIPTLETSTVISSPTLPLHITGMDIQVFPDGGGWLSTSFSNGTYILWHTADSGASWIDTLPKGHSGQAYIGLDSQHAWLYGKTFFQRTTNGGETWESLNPIEEECDVFWCGFRFEDANNGWLEFTDFATGSYYVTLRATQDGGKTWNLVDLKAPYPENQPWKYTIKLSNLCDDRFYFSDQRQMIIHGSTASCSGIYGDNDAGFPDKFGMDLSTDFGQTWTSLSIPWTTDIPKYEEKYKGKHPNIGILPGMPVFFNDNDGILPFEVYDIDKQFTKTPHTKVLIYHTRDGGMHWIPNNIELQDASLNLQVLASQLFIVPCAGELCITKDQARTWKKIPLDPGAPYDFSFINPLVGFVVTMNEFPGTDEHQFFLWKTEDGGANWTQVPISPPNP